MRVIIAAAVDRRGVIGTSRRCPVTHASPLLAKGCVCPPGRVSGICLIHSPTPHRPCQECGSVERSGTIVAPIGDSYPEHVESVKQFTNGAWPPFVPRDHFFTFEQHVAFAHRQGHSHFVVTDPCYFTAAIQVAASLRLTLVDADHVGDARFPRWKSQASLDGNGNWSCSIDGFVPFARDDCPTNPLLTFTRWMRT